MVTPRRPSPTLNASARTRFKGVTAYVRSPVRCFVRREQAPSPLHDSDSSQGPEYPARDTSNRPYVNLAYYPITWSRYTENFLATLAKTVRSLPTAESVWCVCSTTPQAAPPSRMRGNCANAWTSIQRPIRARPAAVLFASDLLARLVLTSHGRERGNSGETKTLSDMNC